MILFFSYEMKYLYLYSVHAMHAKFHGQAFHLGVQQIISSLITASGDAFENNDKKKIGRAITQQRHNHQPTHLQYR